MAYPKAQQNTDTKNQKTGVVNASLYDYRQSPRKVRLVANLVKGKSVHDALVSLTFLDKRASLPIKKLIESAFANAKQMGSDVDALIVSNIVVDKGVVLKRMMPRARGSAARIKKRSSHIVLTLAPRPIKAVKEAKKVAGEAVAAAPAKISKAKKTKA